MRENLYNNHFIKQNLEICILGAILLIFVAFISHQMRTDSSIVVKEYYEETNAFSIQNSDEGSPSLELQSPEIGH